jgi:Ca2+-binding RTX toxin-like protein
LLHTEASFASGDTVSLYDTGANIAALDPDQIHELALAGVDSLDASDNALTLSLDQFNALGTVTLTAGDTVTLQDVAVNIDALTASTIQGLSQEGIDLLKASGGSLTFSYAQTEALLHQTGGGTLAMDGSTTLTVSDTGANISSLTAAELTELGSLGGESGSIDLSGTGAITFSLAQYNAAITATLIIDAGDNVTLSDTAANLGGLNTTALGNLAGNGIDHVSVSDGALTLDLAHLNALGVVDLTGTGTYTLSDTEGNIEALTGGQLGGYVTQGVDVISASGGTLNLTAAQVSPLLGTGAQFASGNTVTLADTSTNIQLLSGTQFGQLAGAGVDKIDASDNALTLSVDQFHGLGTVMLSAGDTNHLQDNFIDFFGMSTSDIASLSGQHVSLLHSTDGVKGFEWSVAQWSQLGSGITVNSVQGTVAVFDTGANDATLTVTQINAFHTAGMNTILDSENGGNLSFTVAQTAAILTDGILVASYPNPASIIGIVADTGTNLATLTTTQIGELSAAGFASVHATDSGVTFSAAQLDALASGSIALTPNDTVNLLDSQANIQGYSASQFTNYATQGVDHFIAVENSLTLNESQVAAVVNSTADFNSPMTVTLSDTAAKISLLSSTQFSEIPGKGVDAIAITAGTLTLSVADYAGLGSIGITGTVQLVDTGADLATLTSTQLAGLTNASITQLDATDNVLSLTADQATAILHQTHGGTVTLGGTDAVTISDTGAHIAGISASDLTALGTDGAGSVTINASDDVLTVSAAQYAAIVGANIALTAGDYVTVSDTGANIAALSPTDLAALATHHVDAVNASDDAITLSISQLDAFHTAGVALTAGDTITLSDTEANIEALTGTQLAAYVTQGVDVFSASGGTLHLTASQVTNVVDNGASFASGNTVSLVDTGANIQALTATQIGNLGSHGVDHIDASDNSFSLSVAQYSALGTTTLTGGDMVTLTDTGANLGALTVTQMSHLAENGIDVLDATDNVLSLSVAKYHALGLGSLSSPDTPVSPVALTQADTVTLLDTGAHIQALSAAKIALLAGDGIDTIDATNNSLAFSVAQLDALGTVTLTAGDNVVLQDAGANLAALTPSAIAALAAQGVDSIDSTTDALSLSVAQYEALGGVTLTAGDTVTLSDTGANIASLTATQIAALAAAGIDAIDASDNAISFSLAQYNALGSLTLAADDILTVNGTSGNDLISGTANSDILKGGAGNDVLLGHGGDDTLIGGSGNNTLNGGAGIDTVNYAASSSGVTINLMSGIASNGAGTDILTSIENVIGSAHNDTITAGAGANTISGLGGDDTFIFGGNLTAADQVNGGAGNDTVRLNGDYSAGLTFNATTMVNVETLHLSAGHSYTLTTDDATVAHGQTLTVDGSGLGSGDSLVFHGNAESDGSFVLMGGAGNDTLVGGARGDTLDGGAGADRLVGGSGADHFVYASASESTGPGFDTIVGFDSRHDQIDLPGSVTGIDAAITTGQLTVANFNANLATAVNASDLAANHAVLFTASSGAYHGQTFLIVDMNGQAGYQAGADLVIHLASPTDLAHLGVGDFI